MEAGILASWDHIMGPQIEYLWYDKGPGAGRYGILPSDVLREFNMTKRNKVPDDFDIWTPFPDLELYSNMCGQLLLGEVDSCKPNDEWVSRLYISESKILFSAVFHMIPLDGSARESKTDRNTCMCFGAIFKRDDPNVVFHNHSLIDGFIRLGVEVLKVVKYNSYEKRMKEATEVVETLKFCVATNQIRSEDNGAIKSLESLFYLHFLKSDLMIKAIVSHLQTSGNSVVIGSSIGTINEAIYGMALFGSKKERSCYVTAPNVTSNSFIKGIYLQGAIKTSDMDIKNLSEQAAKESVSLTIVDVDERKVWQTFCVKDSSDIFRNTLSPVLENGQRVPQLLNDLYFMEKNEGNNKLFLDTFYEYLMVEAASLIKAIEPHRNTPLTAKEVMEMLATPDIEDLKMIFGCAEKLKPGIRNMVV